jgi:deoxyribodipyrimidine photo-lyase
VNRLQEMYRRAGAKLHIVYGEPAAVLEQVLMLHQVKEIVLHQDFTPYAKFRDRQLKKVAARFGIPVTTFVDHALADLAGVHKYAEWREPYRAFTPFFRKWSDYLRLFYRPGSTVSVADLHTTDCHPDVIRRYPPPFSLEEFKAPLNPEAVLRDFLDERLGQYAEQRDLFALDAASSLSRHINVGAISIRTVYETMLGYEQYEHWRRQLAWRDFYLYQSVYDPNFFQYEKLYDLSPLSNRCFDAWRRAETGIPIIDAAMTELNQTGRMPNRLRMVTAMFLTKHLLCPFTLGEQYFRFKLRDYDNTLNRGGWLWSSSLGFEAAPYFRIMNPVTQSQAYDPTGQYIRRWLPKLAHLDDKAIHLPQRHAVVDLRASRARAIEVYRGILGEQEMQEGQG